jgi:hypothetical protein
MEIKRKRVIKFSSYHVLLIGLQRRGFQVTEALAYLNRSKGFVNKRFTVNMDGKEVSM